MEPQEQRCWWGQSQSMAPGQGHLGKEVSQVEVLSAVMQV